VRERIDLDGVDRLAQLVGLPKLLRRADRGGGERVDERVDVLKDDLVGLLLR